MADQKAAQAKNDPAPPAKPALGSAGASSSPFVHQLLAERAIMTSVGNEEEVRAIDARLADLGVSVDA